MKFLKYILILFGLTSALAFSQTESKLLLQNKKGKIIYHLTEGDNVRIVEIDKYKMTKKYKGTLRIINDSQIMVNEKFIHIDSIYRMGKLSTSKFVVGQTIVGIGTTTFVAGIAIMINSIKIENQGIAYIGTLWGSALFGIGTAITIVGGRIINGNPRTVKSDRRIITMKSLS